jgi:CobQ-like glutamine amidotransferase family enzyme
LTLTVVVVYPELLGTYGDGGNGVVLWQRARWRGIEAELRHARSDEPLPDGDVYCLGGGEDGPQVEAADALLADGGLGRAVAGGAAVLAVCAGYQIVGNSFPGAGGEEHRGVGLLDVTTEKGPGRRAVGEILAEPLDPGLPFLTGFENHSGVSTLGVGARPLALVRVGTGNGTSDGGEGTATTGNGKGKGDGIPVRGRRGVLTEGALSGRVVGTYLHGPVLARNPALADLVLGWAVAHWASRRGEEPPVLGLLDDAEEGALRAERLAAVRGRRSRRSAVR